MASHPNLALDGGDGGIQSRQPKKFSMLMVNINRRDFNWQKAGN
jgi:hypothetical protein